MLPRVVDDRLNAAPAGELDANAAVSRLQVLTREPFCPVGYASKLRPPVSTDDQAVSLAVRGTGHSQGTR
jgi:hypothetical protein